MQSVNPKEDKSMSDSTLEDKLPKQVFEAIHHETKRPYYFTGVIDKTEGSTYSYKPVGGWRVCASEDEARGQVFASLKEDYPRYSVKEIVISELDLVKIVNALK